MNSKWSSKKADSINLRRNGVSIRTIEKSLGIPRSTLSYWFKDIRLSYLQREALEDNRKQRLSEARQLAVAWHKEQKRLRLLVAENEAKEVMSQIELSKPILDLALAMLYLGEGAKNGRTSIGNTGPIILKFMLAVLKINYKIKAKDVRCDLHIRADQDSNNLKGYWSSQLKIPLENFRYVAIDKRTIGKKSFDHYKGVCVITCKPIAIQRKLIYLYNIFCKKVIDELGD